MNKTHEIMFLHDLEADLQPADPKNKMERMRLKQGERMGVKCFPFVKNYGDKKGLREMANLELSEGCMLMAVPMSFFCFVEEA